MWIGTRVFGVAGVDVFLPSHVQCREFLKWENVAISYHKFVFAPALFMNIPTIHASNYLPLQLGP